MADLQSQLAGFLVSLLGGVIIRGGAGSPESVVSAAIGSLYLRNDGGANTCLYIKESGAGTNTGWIAK